MKPVTHPDLTRSEAFPEDLSGLLSDPVSTLTESRRGRLWLNLLPVVVALVGIAFAILPPLG
jgi:hypothetical protein